MNASSLSGVTSHLKEAASMQDLKIAAKQISLAEIQGFSILKVCSKY